MSVKAGLPIWNKTLIVHAKTETNPNARETTDSAYRIFIPMVKEGTQFINAVLIGSIENKDTAFQLIYASQYKSFAFGTPKRGKWNARNLFHLFTVLEKDVFGHTKFLVKDKRLFPSDTLLAQDSFYVNFSFNKNSDKKSTLGRLESITYCTEGQFVVDCPLKPFRTVSLMAPCYEYRNYCTTFWYEVSDEGGSGGTGDTGGGGGGTSDPDPIDDPCDDGLPVNRIDSPCEEEPGWEPVPIDPDDNYTINPNEYYLELDEFVSDIRVRNAYKLLYHELIIHYQSRPVDQYTNMSRDEFLQMLVNNPTVAISIDPVTILAKIGINAAADVLTQIFFIKLTNPAVETWSQAFDNIDWVQVAGTAITGLIPWNTTSGKFIVSAINGATAVLSDLAQDGFTSWGHSGIRFVEGFCGSLIGNSIGDVVSKFGNINNFGKALVTRLDNYFPYRTVCKWLGGGLQTITKSFNHTLSNGQTITITSTKMMKGWNAQKIAVIGRSQDDRVVPFANKLSAELGIHVHQIKEWTGWNSNLTVEQNVLWIKKLKEEGYTVYDIGTDPRYGNDKGPFYGMEYQEIFGN